MLGCIQHPFKSIGEINNCAEEHHNGIYCKYFNEKKK
jgi:hypothetical protein